MHFLIQPANKNPKKQEAYEKLVEMSRNDDYTKETCLISCIIKIFETHIISISH